MVHKVPEEESGAGGCDLLYDQASKLSGRFGLPANAEYTSNFFQKLSEGSKFSEGSEIRKLPKFRKVSKFSEGSEISETAEIFVRFQNFGRFQNFRKRPIFRNAFQNAGPT